jgi:hypothetical protein
VLKRHYSTLLAMLSKTNNKKDLELLERSAAAAVLSGRWEIPKNGWIDG